MGAGGASAYYNKDAVGDAVRAALTPAWLSGQHGGGSGGGVGSPQIDELSRAVQQLSLDVQRRGTGGVTIMQGPYRGCVRAMTLDTVVVFDNASSVYPL